MDRLFLGVAAGVLGTMVMDSLNLLLARAGLLSKIDVNMIGRMAAGWLDGRFRYSHPDEMQQIPHETFYGYLAHYVIGVSLALPFVLGWDLWLARPVSPLWALAYGVATTAASYFLVFPSIGFGFAGRRSPEGIRAPLSALANHLFYGFGLAGGIAVL